jgi:hypothetical protein
MYNYVSVGIQFHFGEGFPAMIQYGEFAYDPASRASFREGTLREQWFKQYPMLFKEADIKLAVAQPQYHFIEWLGAIRIFEDLKYLCLVEKYQFKKHIVPRELFKQIVPANVYELVVSRELGKGQAPDLFAYSLDQKDWFFCEVKGNKDRISQTQEKYFTRLEQKSGKEVRILKFYPTHLA